MAVAVGGGRRPTEVARVVRRPRGTVEVGEPSAGSNEEEEEEEEEEESALSLGREARE